MSMAVIEQARLAECERLLKEQAVMIAVMREELESLKLQRPTLSLRGKRIEAAQPT